ncbi:MAG: PAS domain-containing protein [Cytophagales bacterium]|nr:PAS domain-containing protein [Bernardetiaceae bacterium]MDW8210805.1 PAS domain-containing protein [Cytophagales bacterium]
MAIELTASDIEIIANAAGCSKKEVHHVLKGKRGQRNTPLQQKIKLLANLRQQQNEALQFLGAIEQFNTSGFSPKGLNGFKELKHLLSSYVIDSNHDGVFAFNHQLQYTLWNKRMEELSGIPAEQAIGKTPCQIYHTAPQAIDYQKDNLVKQRVLQGEYVSFPAKAYTYPNGKQYWHELYFSPLRDNAHNIIGGVCIVKDVTDYIRKQQELSECIARYEIAEVFTSTAVCKGWMQNNYYWLEWISPSFTSLFGYTLEQFNLASRQYRGWITNEAQALRYKATEQNLLDGKAVKDFVLFAHRNGRLIPSACYYKPLPPTKQGNAAFLLAINEVHTEKENNWRIRDFFEDADNFFAILQSKTFDIIYANASLARYAKNNAAVGQSFIETHRRSHQRELKQALFELQKVFDRSYAILDMGTNRAFDNRTLVWLFVQANPANIYAVGKILI